MDGTLVGIRKEIVFAAEPPVNHSRADFFKGFTKEEAANKIHATPAASQGLKQFAYAVLETKGGSYYGAVPRRAGPPVAHGVPPTAPAAPPSALVSAVEDTMASRGAGIQAFQLALTQMQDMMEKGAQLLKDMQQEREAGEPARKARA